MKLDTLKNGDRFIANGSEYTFIEMTKHKGGEVARCIKTDGDVPYLIRLTVEVEKKDEN